MGKLLLLPVATALLAAIPAANSPESRSVDYKLDRIRSGQVQPGSSVVFTAHELNVWVAGEVPRYAPRGVRNTRLDLQKGTVEASASIDFLKVRQTHGVETSWLIAKLIEGEHPVRVNARIQSGGGKAAVYLKRVEISGISVSGSTLDFLINNFFRPLFPDAKINQPFGLEDNVERIEIHPNLAKAVMKPAPPPRPARARG